MTWITKFLSRCISVCQFFFVLYCSAHERLHIWEQMGSADPPGKMDEKLKSENMQKKSSVLCLCYILRAIRAGRCRERRYADHIFIQIYMYFRMHHFVVKFSKFSSPRAARGQGGGRCWQCGRYRGSVGFQSVAWRRLLCVGLLLPRRPGRVFADRRHQPLHHRHRICVRLGALRPNAGMTSRSWPLAMIFSLRT